MSSGTSEPWALKCCLPIQESSMWSCLPDSFKVLGQYMADESHWKHCWWLRAGKRGWFKEIPQGWVCMTRVPKKEKLQKKEAHIISWIAAAASFRLLFQKLCFIEVTPRGCHCESANLTLLWLRSNQHQSWRPSAPEIPSMQDVGRDSCGKKCFAVPFFLFKEKMGAFKRWEER